MAKQSPLQKVKAAHGSKEQLAKKVLAFLTCPEGEEQAHFEKRISVMSNIKLLRLFDANEKLTSTWKTRAAVIDAVTKAKFPGGNADYANKLNSFSTARLVGLAQQLKLKS